MPGNGKPTLPSTSPANPVGAPNNNKNGGGGAVGESKMINGTPQERKPGVIGVSTAKVGKQGKKAGDTLDETQASCGPSSKKKKVRSPEGFIFHCRLCNKLRNANPNFRSHYPKRRVAARKRVVSKVKHLNSRQ